MTIDRLMTTQCKEDRLRLRGGCSVVAAFAAIGSDGSRRRQDDPRR